MHLKTKVMAKLIFTKVRNAAACNIMWTTLNKFYFRQVRY